jgi:hypothetical protein
MKLQDYVLLTVIVRVYVYQYSETNVMHFLFNLLRFKGLRVSSITCSSSGGATHTVLDILHAEISRYLKVLIYIVIKS